MMELKRYSCITCGAPLKEQDGKFVCANCKNEFHLEEKISEEEVVALNRATTDRNLLRFDDAFEEYELLLKKYPQNEMANWGAFLSFYGIVYEQDLDGKYIPTCHRLSEKPIESSKYYYLFNDEHKRRAQEIEALRVAILEKAKRIPPYDVFICYKATEERFGRPYPTKEASWARDVYEMLTHELKLRVFFAEKSLGDSNEEYEPHIYSALNSAKLMFVMTTGIENVNAVWVKNEWKRYSKYVQEGQKKTIRVVYDNIEPYDLPLELQKTQAINHNDIDWGKKVRKAAQAIFVDPLEEERKKKEAEETAKKEKEEAEARERAREEELQKMREAMEALKKQANTPQAAPAPAAPKPVLPADKYCVKCGAGNVENAKFCSSCGHKEFAPEFKKYCFECGTERGLLEKICPECGETRCVYTKEDYKKEVENRERRRRIEEEQAAREAQKRELVRMQMEAAARLAAEKSAQEAEEKRRKEAIARDFEIINGTLKKYKGSATEVVIPDYVTRIEARAFDNHDALKNIIIPDSVSFIDEEAFFVCLNLVSIVVDKNNKEYKSIEGNLYTKDGKVLIKYVAGKKEKSFIIPNSVTSIGKAAFAGGRSLVDIVIPNNVADIADEAFIGCSSLASISIPDGVTSIGEKVFFNCHGLRAVIMPNSIKSIGSYAFFDCNSLRNIIIPDSVTSIAMQAFKGCNNLTIYACAEKKPKDWHEKRGFLGIGITESWNSDNRPVVWGYKGN